MRNRGVVFVLVLSIVTFGLYSVYWMISTKIEMNEKGAQVPTAWLLLIPLVSIYWLWRYSEGVEHVTRGALSGPVAFLLLFLLGVIGVMIIQAKFNEVVEPSTNLPQARIHTN